MEKNSQWKHRKCCNSPIREGYKVSESHVRSLTLLRGCKVIVADEKDPEEIIMNEGEIVGIIVDRADLTGT